MRRIVITVAVALASGLLLAGCVETGPVGRWVRSPEVERQFRSGRPLRDHTYYYYGEAVAPDAILAIDNRYHLRTKVWSRVAITDTMLADWMYGITTEPVFARPYYGGILLGPEDQQIGVWYTRKQRTTIRMLDPVTVQVYMPYNARGPCTETERFDDR